MTLKNCLKENKFTVGSWITLGHCGIAEIISQAGFQWLTIDLEHSAISISQAEELIRVIALCGLTPLVRISDNDPVQIKRVMDAGAHGIIVPMVTSPEQAKSAVDAVRYPPGGTRGVGLARARGYGQTFKEYAEWIAEEAIVIALIEHIEAIHNLEGILSVEGIDGSIIGPYDLSGSLGAPGNFTEPKVLDAIQRYEDMCRAMNKPMGFHVVQPDAQTAVQYRKKGYAFIALGVDILFLGNTCRQVLQTLSTATEP